MLTKALVMDEGWHVVWPNAQLWVIRPTGSALLWFNVFYDCCSALGPDRRGWVVLEWRRYAPPGSGGLAHPSGGSHPRTWPARNLGARSAPEMIRP